MREEFPCQTRGPVGKGYRGARLAYAHETSADRDMSAPTERLGDKGAYVRRGSCKDDWIFAMDGQTTF